MSVATGVTWTIANEHCRTQTDSLVDILDVENHFSYFKGITPIWSSVNICWSATKKHLTKTSFCHILEIAILSANRGIIQMGVVQTMYIFSLVSRVQFAYVCAIAISRKLYRKVLNATICVGDLLVMANVVD